MKRVFNDIDMRWLAFHLREVSPCSVEADGCGVNEGWAPLEREALMAVVCEMVVDIADSLGETCAYSPSDYKLEDCPATISILRDYGLRAKGGKS